MKKLIFILLLIINFLYSKEKTDITLQLNWLNQFQFAGYYIAKEKGYYKDLGLNVTINELNSKEELITIIKNKKADFGIGRSSLIIDKINGEDIVALAAIFQHSPLMLLTTNENIKSIKDIKHKKIMITPDAEATASITAMLNSNNINYDDLEILSHSFDIDDLINKKTDLMASYISNEPIRLENRKINYKIFHPKDFGFDFYSDILFTSSEFVNNNPKTTKAFYDATLRGWKYAFENKIEAAELIYEKYNTQNKTILALIKEGNILEKLAKTEENEKIGKLSYEKLTDIYNTFNILGLVKGDLDLHSFVYKYNKENIFKIELDSKEISILSLLALFSIFLFLLIMYFFNKIRSNRELLQTVLNSTNDLVYYKDYNLKYLGCNLAFENFVGKSKNEIIGKNDFELFDEKVALNFREEDLKVLKTFDIYTNNEEIKINNTILQFQSKRFPLRYKVKKGIGVLAVCRDITQLYKIQKKLEEQAIRDELTKCFNRKLFNIKMSEHIHLVKRYSKNFCIALMDIDDFKNINDTYGHDIGDLILIEFSKVIKNNIRDTDILFRVGGEEFLIMYPETSQAEAYISVENIRKLIQEHQFTNDIKITSSIGLTQALNIDDEKSLFKRVDELMYYSKNNGKNRTTIKT